MGNEVTEAPPVVLRQKEWILHVGTGKTAIKGLKQRNNCASLQLPPPPSSLQGKFLKRLHFSALLPTLFPALQDCKTLTVPFMSSAHPMSLVSLDCMCSIVAHGPVDYQLSLFLTAFLLYFIVIVSSLHCKLPFSTFKNIASNEEGILGLQYFQSIYMLPG